MVPEPVTDPARDIGRRAQSIYDLEETLVKFLTTLFASYQLDNPTLNLAQASVPSQEPLPLPGPDEQVTYDPTERAQTLYLKVSPRVCRGRVPRTVTGEIAIDKLPDVPSVIVQAVSAKIERADSHDETIVTVRIWATTYDENPDASGYQDVQNMLETMSIALTTFGQAGIDKAYPIVMPLDWKLVEADTFPHFVGELTTMWQLPAGRPMPDSDDITGLIPGEHLSVVLDNAPEYQ